MLEQLIINKKSKSSTKKEMFFKIFSVIKFHNPPFYNVYACEIFLFHGLKFFVCEFPLAACKLLLLAPLIRTPLQKNLFHPKAFGNNSAPCKSGLKIEGFHFFFSPYLFKPLYHFKCAVDNLSRKLVDEEVSHFSGTLSVSPRIKCKDWESTFLF